MLFMRNIIFLLLFFSSMSSYGQSINEEKTSLINFIKRMYNAAPFEGVKIVDDYEGQHLISVILLEDSKYTNESVKNRVAQVKAQSQASTFLNGANISMDLIISSKEITNEGKEVTSITETFEKIKQNSSGFSQGLELLTNFKNNENSKTIFIYARELKY